jgi:ATP-dependent Clp protease ATP-binding subunit ClpA
MIDAAIAQKTGVPRVFLDKENLAANADKMKSYLKSLVKGIDDIIDQMVNDLFAFALEANRADWPVLRALAMGPTGTGKTELIKAVTNFLFNSQAPRLKISGEDWKTPDGDRLKDLIVRHTKQFPYNIIHYDEFDKMHPENQETVLSLGDGEIVGSEGEKVSTSLSIIYGASNLGVAAVRAAVAASRMKVGAQSYNSPSSLGNEFNDIFLTAMRNELKPEVVNRFDRYYVYPFMKDDIALAITEDYLNGIEGSGIESIRARYAKKGISLEFDKSVIRYIADNFIDLELGGRRLTINIENAVVKEFLVPTELYGGLKANGTKYVVTYNGRAFEIFQIDKNLISTSTGITNPTAH